MRGQNAHHGIVVIVEFYRFAQHVRIAGKMAAPQAISEEHHVAASGLVLLRQEITAERGPYAQCLEETGRDPRATQALRTIAAGEVVVTAAVGRQLLEAVILRRPVREVGVGSYVVLRSRPRKSMAQIRTS